MEGNNISYTFSTTNKHVLISMTSLCIFSLRARVTVWDKLGDKIRADLENHQNHAPIIILTGCKVSTYNSE